MSVNYLLGNYVDFLPDLKDGVDFGFQPMFSDNQSEPLA